MLLGSRHSNQFGAAMQLRVGTPVWPEIWHETWCGSREASSQRRWRQSATRVAAPIPVQLENNQSKLTHGLAPTCGGTSFAGRHAVSPPRSPMREFAEQCGCIDEAEERLLDSDCR